MASEECLGPDAIMSMESEARQTFMIFMFLYAAIFILTLLMLKCLSKFDTVYGFVAYLRSKEYMKRSITTILILYLLWILLVPIIFAVVWGAWMH